MVVLDEAHNRVLRLNETALYILDALKAGTPAERIAQSLALDWEVSVDMARADVMATETELRTLSLLL